MLTFKWLGLQLFADGAGDGAGAGGDGANTGVTADAAGQQMLQDMGVPEHLAKKRAKAFTQRMQRNGTPLQTAPKQEEQQAAAAQTPEQTNDVPKRMTWDEIMADEEYKARYNESVSKTVQARLKNERGARETLDKLAPTIEALCSKHGLDPKNPDYEALAKAVGDDDPAIDELAVKLGTSRETARSLLDNRRENERLKADKERRRQEEAQAERSRIEAEHYRKLVEQGEALKKVFPSFDLQKELQNDAFCRMTAPGRGFVSVEDAYCLIHRKEIQAAEAEVVAKRTAEQMANAIRSNGMRPDENGTTGQAPTTSVVDPRRMTPQERADIRRRIKAGEKISF